MLDVFSVQNLGSARAKCRGGEMSKKGVSALALFFMIKNAQGDALIYSAVIDTSRWTIN